MPIVKDPQSQPMLKDAVVLDLGDIANEGKRLREQAQAEAERIIHEAKQQAQTLTEGAATQGYNEGFVQGKAEGAEQGRAEGHDEALSQMSEQIEQITQAWTTLASDWDNQRQQMHREAKQSVLELAICLAEKVIKQRVDTDPQVVDEQVNDALTNVLEHADVTVHIHPDDRPILEAALPRIVESFSNLNHVHLIDGPALSRGGCVINHGQGRIDATIETQLQRITERLKPIKPGDAASPGFSA